MEERKRVELLWVHFANLFLGFWLLVSHAAFGYHDRFYSLNEWFCGGVVVLFSLLSLRKKAIFPPWIVCFTGIWLMFAPLVKSAHLVQIYLNETMVGALLIVFSLLIPGLPGVIEEKGKGIPPGWSYNPSAWMQRIPVIGLACVGWMISRYLMAYQLGYIGAVWDPVFGEGTAKVITSNLSKQFPISDAGLGAFAYTLEALMGCKGGANRWRTMPWLVVAFAFLVVPLGIVSILLVISQPLLVHHWCFLCLLTAFSMLIMVALTVDEMVAVLCFLTSATKEGKGLWRTFFKGGDCRGTKDDDRTLSFDANPLSQMATWRFGISFPPNLIVCLILGTYLMLTPTNYLAGALVIVCSMISFAEVSRSFRWFLPLLGACVAFVNIYQIWVALLLVILAIPRGKIKESYGTWSKYIR